ncbi:hypothetical protein EDP2_1751 [Enterobacter cloacae S611]|uniref:Uncharacterized protein n=1 Tax=Enterobacter cloacae S611 TaxID=1399146 RepID=A0ABN0Q916_ENTCL|nr:hypothetical protein EDP2_1751 [Enterobacter cloacae S611]
MHLHCYYSRLISRNFLLTSFLNDSYGAALLYAA